MWKEQEFVSFFSHRIVHVHLHFIMNHNLRLFIILFVTIHKFLQSTLMEVHYRVYQIVPKLHKFVQLQLFVFIFFHINSHFHQHSSTKNRFIFNTLALFLYLHFIVTIFLAYSPTVSQLDTDWFISLRTFHSYNRSISID